MASLDYCTNQLKQEGFALTTAILETEHLSREVGGVRIVDDVTVKVPRGELLVVVGPSGAGKSSFLRLLNTNSLVLNRFRSEVESHAVLIETGLALGAESEQTVAPYVQVSPQTFQTHLAPDGVTADRHWLFSPISRIREESDAS